jgi:hypothetical protein
MVLLVIKENKMSKLKTTIKDNIVLALGIITILGFMALLIYVDIKKNTTLTQEVNSGKYDLSCVGDNLRYYLEANQYKIFDEYVSAHNLVFRKKRCEVLEKDVQQ